MIFTIEIHHGGTWHDAARVVLEEGAIGIAGNPVYGIRCPSRTDYDVSYALGNWNVAGLNGATLIGIHALSVNLPVNLDTTRHDHWPPFLVDLIPQGHVRKRIATEVGLGPDDPRLDLILLQRGGGNPVGNLRIKEARNDEQERARGENFEGFELDEMIAGSDRFMEAADRYALLATGTSAMQGEWPKLLMTRWDDGLWYPDSVTPDKAAREHVIVKMMRRSEPADRLILASEAPYLEVARAFGIRVGGGLRYANEKLIVPRFDRLVTYRGVTRFGQESLVSAIGRAEFGFIGTHEEYLEKLRLVSSDPAQDTIEYLLRDLLNLAMGNPDNHGRNTALQKHVDGSIRLSPLFDFAPMRLEPSGIARSTKWHVLEGRDFDPDWEKVCIAAAGDGAAITPERLRQVLASKAEFIRELPAIARAHGVHEDVIGGAFADCAKIADRLRKLEE